MKARLQTALILLLALGALGCRRETKLADVQLRQFVEAKHAQARELVGVQQLHMPARGWKLFEAILSDNLSQSTNRFNQLLTERFAYTNPPSAITKLFDQTQGELTKRGWYAPTGSALDGAAWQTLVEACWSYREAKAWNSTLHKDIVREIISAIPSNTVYFGGTDVGRFSVVAELGAKTNERKFILLTQNQLMDYGYLDFARLEYGRGMVLPYAMEAVTGWNRLFSVTNNPTPTQVMRENGELVHCILKQNPEREFYVEQQFIIESLYPHLLPHGPIQKMSHQPLARLSEEVVAADRAYWAAFCRRYIGDWIKPGMTSIAEVSDFCERVYVQKRTEGYTGDRNFLAVPRAQDYFAKLRLATARLYLWRCVMAEEASEKGRYWTECLLAFEQAFALGSINPEVAWDFADALSQVQRYDEAIRILTICQKLNPTMAQLQIEIDRVKARKLQGN